MHISPGLRRTACTGAALCQIWSFAQVSSSGPELLSGGDGTVFDVTRNAFSLPARNLDEQRRAAFFVGNSFFNQNWVIAPASTAARDGLGPLFNSRSCSGCHFKDGRGRPPDANEPLESMLLRLSLPGVDEHGGPQPEPTYGDQIQGLSIPGAPREADVFVDYVEREGRFGDGTPFSLRRPSYRIEHLGYGSLAAGVLISPRVAPAMIGLGLLEAVPESALAKLADPDDRDGDGISGRTNSVWSIAVRRMAIGRFGWKAEQPTVAEQAAAAFDGDMGITSPLIERENHTAAEQAARQLPSGGMPEVGADIFDAVALYARSLAVPAARATAAPSESRGRALFDAAGCVACHVPELKTGTQAAQPEFVNQVIHPFTDLLLHDMGPDLADDRPVFGASGREWRTPPLWGLGLIQKVNGHTFLLHDGRARDAGEAILWHGGEAAVARDRFAAMSAPDRAALLTFLDSL